jgi:RND family efflux transporter MFP subunit
MLQLDNAEAQANVMGLKGSFINSVLAILPDLNTDYPEAYAAWEAYYNALSLNSALVPMPKTASKLEKFLIARGIPTAYYQVKSAEERLEKFCIRAPFDGVVAQASVKKGNLVSPGRALGSFVGSGGFELKGAVTLSYADELKLGQSITFTSPDRKGIWKGQIDRISPVVDDASQNINLIASLRGDDLKEGMYLTGTIANVEVYDALRVPAYMVFDNEYVYTVESDSLLAKTAVEVVEWLDESIVIKGLKNGQLLADAPTLKAASGTIVVAVKN